MVLRILSRLLNFKQGSRSPKILTTLLTNRTALAISALVTLVALVLGVLLVRLSQCLPRHKTTRKKRLNTFNLRTMVIFGSGGHTTEMIMLVQNVPWFRHGPVHCVLAQTDHTSRAKVESANVDLLNGCTWHTISRSREVKQSWFTTVFTTLWSVVDAFRLVWRISPRLIICNGPGTCVPICYVAFLYQLLGLLDVDIVYVESFCRVQHLSLTGKLLYPIANKFIVQWPSLTAGYKRAEYLGDFKPDSSS